MRLSLGGAHSPVQVIGSAEEVRAVGSRPTPATFGSPVVVAEYSPPAGPPELPLIARHCEIKAEACRWAADRRRWLREDPDTVQARDREMFTKAKSTPGCYLWMMAPKGPSLPDDDTLQKLSGCYDALAQALDLVVFLEQAEGAEPFFEDALYLLAEAQSAVRWGLLEVDRALEDYDQKGIFFWLKTQAQERRIFINRYMKVDDPADPEAWHDLQERIDSLRESWDRRRQQGLSRRKLINKARYHAERAVRPDGSSSDADWRTLASAVEQLVQSGVPPSDLELRELLLPLLEANMPDLDLGPGMRDVMAEVDRYLATAAVARAAAAEAAEPERDAEIIAVADLLRGKKVLLVGGICRPHAQRALEKNFELEELVWPSTDAHESLSKFDSAIADPKVALVLLAIRWSSHSYGELRSLCETYRKPFVRLPAGYNPQQVARQILSQCSQTLQSSQAKPNGG